MEGTGEITVHLATDNGLLAILVPHGLMHRTGDYLWWTREEELLDEANAGHVVPIETGESGGTTSDWVLLTRHKSFILKPSIVEATEPVVPRPDWRLWTDSYNNLLQVFKY